MSIAQGTETFTFVPRITYLWQNDMVMTFGEDGQQIPELQGPLNVQLAAKLSRRSTDRTEWYTGRWGVSMDKVDHDSWMREAEYRLWVMMKL